MSEHRIPIVGAGLAGCECALALASRGHAVTLYEQKPTRFSPAHAVADLAELVCSNSFRSDAPDAAVGVLKAEMRDLGSAVMAAAEAERTPAGQALAVDRDAFARHMTARIEAEPRIELVRREILSLEDPAIAAALAASAPAVIAAGPLASESLSRSLAEAVGAAHLYFYDAIAPIVAADSIDESIAFRASRASHKERARRRPPADATPCEPPHDVSSPDSPAPEEPGDYLNCPMNEAEYDAFRDALLKAATVPCRDFEEERHFEGCMPVEALAARGRMTLAYGSLKPVGLVDPRTGETPFAVLQLRPENRDLSAYNLVGCQTKMKYGEQRRVFRMVPGLERAEFERLGSMHRNTYLDAPVSLAPAGDLTTRPNCFLTGQITGVEGYVESAAHGLWLGLALAARMQGRVLSPPPETTMLGALLGHLRRPVKRFQPSNANFGLAPALNRRAPKWKRKQLYAERAREDFAAWRKAADLER